MKEKSYAEKLKSPKWQKKRLEILNRDNFTCKLCGDTETQLHVHHLKYKKNCDPWEYDNKSLITLCEECHKIIEEAKEESADFQDIKIFKSTWDFGGKIMFIYYNNICRMTVSNKTDPSMTFLIPDWHIKEIAEYLKSTYHG